MYGKSPKNCICPDRIWPSNFFMGNTFPTQTKLQSGLPGNIVFTLVCTAALSGPRPRAALSAIFLLYMWLYRSCLQIISHTAYCNILSSTRIPCSICPNLVRPYLQRQPNIAQITASLSMDLVKTCPYLLSANLIRLGLGEEFYSNWIIMTHQHSSNVIT